VGVAVHGDGGDVTRPQGRYKRVPVTGRCAGVRTSQSSDRDGQCDNVNGVSGAVLLSLSRGRVPTQATCSSSSRR
jgi:hypothetical protein